MKRQSKFFEELWRSLPFQNQVSMKLEIERGKQYGRKHKKRLDQQFDFIREIDRENLLGDKPIYRMADERKMMRSMPGIWRS